MKTIEIEDRAAWRAWLAANHDKESEVWLVYYKKHTGRSSVAYGASVEEALCFGWVDSLIKKLDEDRYARKFTPRKEDSKWSPSNIKRVEKMVAAGLMTEAGLRLVAAAKVSGSWDNPQQAPQLTFEMTDAFSEALQANPAARETFERLSFTDRKRYLGWIEVAKRPETKAKRVDESIRLLAEGKKLGLK